MSNISIAVKIVRKLNDRNGIFIDFDKDVMVEMYAEIESLISQAVSAERKRIREGLPEESDNHRLFLVVSDQNRSEEEIRLFAKLRQDGHNKAIRAVKLIIDGKTE